MWMFLFGLIVGIILMILWHAYTKDRTDFSSPALKDASEQSSSTTAAAQAVKRDDTAPSHETATKVASNSASASTKTNDSAVKVAPSSPSPSTDFATNAVKYEASTASASPDHENEKEATSGTSGRVDASPSSAASSSEKLDNNTDADITETQSSSEPLVTGSSISDSVDATTAMTEQLDSDNAAEQTVDIDALKAGLPKAESTEADDLKTIKGVGPKLEGMLNELGIITFKQVSLLDDQQAKEVSLAIKTFPDRIFRDQWIEQAKQLHEEKYSS